MSEVTQMEKSLDNIYIVACARNENENINEWIEYNKYIGVDGIYLYCNDDNPAAMIKHILPYMQGPDPFVKLIHFKGEGEQKLMYKHFINHYLKPDSWVGFIDIDEFVTLKCNLSLKDFLNKFSSVDAVHFCWVNFGPDNNDYNPTFSTLRSLTKRNRYPNAHGKVFINSNIIDKIWMNEGYGTFFHGFGDGGLGRKHKPFNEKVACISNVWGEDFYDKYENDFSEYAIKNERNIFETAYISHYQMRSFEHLFHRAQRKMQGDFADQSRWRDMIVNNTFWTMIAPDNAVEDTFLKDLNAVNFSFVEAEKE